MTLLTLCQRATDQVGLDRLSAVVGSVQPEARRLLALANEAGEDLLAKHAWRVLVTEHTFSTVASTATYALPSDFDRLLADTAWDRTNYWRMRGQQSPREWQERVSSTTSSADIRRVWRIKPSAGAKVFAIDPTPSSADSLVFEYVSNLWCEASDGTGQSLFAADTDVARIPERLIRLQLVWRLLASHGHPYFEQKAAADEAERQLIGHDIMPAPVMVGAGPRRWPMVNWPEANWTL